ncbi:acyl-CoA dehydrogenase family protein [Cupriavidus nantongensis]|uniref:acyl-CoA dehydrogenase family protein n=1 Tax=Cupriavidus nantongensis TaxID=1796606 RepID=UPI002247D1F3|nr:acyl-CoA dehydrogenase family protein [Cupriavidus nantongensis]
MYAFSEETRAIRELVRRLVDDFQMPLEARVLRGEKLTRADYAPGRRAAREAGLWRLGVPQDLGGAGLPLVTLLAITEENFRCLTPLRFGGRALPNLYALQGEQRERYLEPFLNDTKLLAFAQTEPGGGADPAGAIQTFARRQGDGDKDGDGWVLNGTKVFISNVADADVVFVVARTDKEKRAGGISMFAVETGNPGMIRREIPMLGGFFTHELIFDDCRVPAHALVSSEGGGFRQAQQALSAARFDVAARALGIAQRCLEMMIAYSKERKVFGEPLAALQATQSAIVDSWVEIQQNRLLVYRSAERHDAGEDTRVEAGMVKMTCTEMVDRVIDRAIQLYGAAGCALDNPLAHWYNHQRLARIYEGPTELHKYRVLARHLLS